MLLQVHEIYTHLAVMSSSACSLKWIMFILRTSIYRGYMWACCFMIRGSTESSLTCNSRPETSLHNVLLRPSLSCSLSGTDFLQKKAYIVYCYTIYMATERWKWARKTRESESTSSSQCSKNSQHWRRKSGSILKKPQIGNIHHEAFYGPERAFLKKPR